jgi:anti-anti-sigma regulatory factor
MVWATIRLAAPGLAESIRAFRRDASRAAVSPDRSPGYVDLWVKPRAPLQQWFNHRIAVGGSSVMFEQYDSDTAPDQFVAGPSQRRREAIATTRAELAAAAVPTSQPAIATRSYGDGQLSVSLAGTFDRAAVERLRGTLRDLGRVASDELVIDMAGLASCNSSLARFLAQLRVQRLIAGTRVELHDVPPELATALGHSPPEKFAVHDHDDQRSGAVAPLPRSAP